MKKKILAVIAVFMCCLLTLPTTAYARSYDVEGTDLSIEIDDSRWYVFTRDNIKNNSELEVIGLSYDNIYEFLYNNDAYVDAVLIYDEGDIVELLIRKVSVDANTNMSNFADEEILLEAKKLAEKNGATKYSVYKSQYKFIMLEKEDEDAYACHYITFVNGDEYNVSIQATGRLSNTDRNEIKNIIDSIHFDISQPTKKGGSSATVSFADEAIEGAVLGAIGAGVFLIIVKKRQNAQKAQQQREKNDINVIDDTKKVESTENPAEILLKRQGETNISKRTVEQTSARKPIEEKLAYALQYTTIEGTRRYLQLEQTKSDDEEEKEILARLLETDDSRLSEQIKTVLRDRTQE